METIIYDKCQISQKLLIISRIDRWFEIPTPNLSDQAAGRGSGVTRKRKNHRYRCCT